MYFVYCALCRWDILENDKSLTFGTKVGFGDDFENGPKFRKQFVECVRERWYFYLLFEIAYIDSELGSAIIAEVP